MTGGRAVDGLFERVADAVEHALGPGPPPLALEQRGTVAQVGGGIARVRGLPAVGAEELVEFPGGLLGIAIDIEEEEIGVVLLGESRALAAGDEVRATGRVTDTPVGESLLGRVIDATGRPLDGSAPIRSAGRWPIERDAPAIMDRAPVVEPLQTGIKAVDAMIPIGRGQRELIVGDRQTGKTSIAVGAIINQKATDVVSIYCAVGQRGTAVARVIDTLARHDALERTVVVAASGEDAAGLQYITPYAATTMAEYFMEQGRDVLIVYDDLVRHARVYRELSLLLRRPPGREAFPGDIFYVHSRMLERATRLHDERGGGSLTALPIVETEAQDISAYIPTNLISITDGQIYVSPRLFRAGLLPAIDIGRSVSRVGGKTQRAAYRAVVGDLKLSYAQFEELETFARFGTRLDEDTKAAIERGKRVREILKQDEYAALGVAEQLASLEAVHSGLFDALDPEEIGAAEPQLHDLVRRRLPALASRIESGAPLADDDRAALRDAAGEVVAAVIERRTSAADAKA